MHASRRHTGVIVADDLTGALDTAVPFAARGWHAEVIVGGREMATAATETADTATATVSAPSAIALISSAIPGSAAAHRSGEPPSGGPAPDRLLHDGRSAPGGAVFVGLPHLRGGGRGQPSPARVDEYPADDAGG